MGEDDVPFVDEITDDELELLLTMMQQSTFPEWRGKLLAGKVQMRLDEELKKRRGNG